MDPIGRQLDYLCQAVTNLEGRMDQQIDPRAFGQLEGDVRALTREVNGLRKDFGDLAEKVDKLVDAMSEARGGWKLTLMFGTIATAVGGAVSWAISHVTLR